MSEPVSAPVSTPTTSIAGFDRASAPGDDLQARLEGFFRLQSAACTGVGSPLYAELCGRIGDDVRAGGVCWELLQSRAHLPFGRALALRFLGALHRRALSGAAPQLAAHYPSCGGSPGEGLWAAFEAAVRDDAEAISSELDADVQTNEVGRSAVLFEALGRVADATSGSLRLCEIGASAGLNLAMPWFRYRDGDRLGGDPHGTVEIADRWRGDVRPQFRSIAVASRAGCDAAPVDATTDVGMLRLLGFLWPDQLDRMARTRLAIETLRQHPVPIDAANAPDWLEAQLIDTSEDGESRTTVVYHSIVWQYVGHDDRARITAIMEAAGALATMRRPLAWVRFEPSDDHLHAHTTLRLWNGGEHTGTPVSVARSGFHGEWVELC